MSGRVAGAAVHWAVPAGAEFDPDPEDTSRELGLWPHIHYDPWLVAEKSFTFHQTVNHRYKWDLDDFGDVIYDPSADESGDLDDVGYDDVAPLRGPVRTHEGVFDDLTDVIGTFVPGDGVQRPVPMYLRLERAAAEKRELVDRVHRQRVIDKHRARVIRMLQERAAEIAREQAILRAEREIDDIARRRKWARKQARLVREREFKRQQRREREECERQERLARMNDYERKVYELWGD
jgi:hypothetical protein